MHFTIRSTHLSSYLRLFWDYLGYLSIYWKQTLYTIFFIPAFFPSVSLFQAYFKKQWQWFKNVLILTTHMKRLPPVTGILVRCRNVGKGCSLNGHKSKIGYFLFFIKGQHIGWCHLTSLGFNPARGSLDLFFEDLFPMFLWVSSGCIGFLLQSKDIHLWLIKD